VLTTSSLKSTPPDPSACIFLEELLHMRRRAGVTCVELNVRLERVGELTDAALLRRRRAGRAHVTRQRGGVEVGASGGERGVVSAQSACVEADVLTSDVIIPAESVALSARRRAPSAF
jgi:hypothetical protein